MTDFVKTYNPANAAALTPQELSDLQLLTSEQIKQLAKAYPNEAFGRAYLLIVDGTKPVEKQLPSLSTFENLWNLREKNGLRNYVAFNFKGNIAAIVSKTVKVRKTEVLDLSDAELMTLPGFKVSNYLPPEDLKVPVKEIKKPKNKKSQNA